MLTPIDDSAALRCARQALNPLTGRPYTTGACVSPVNDLSRLRLEARAAWLRLPAKARRQLVRGLLELAKDVAEWR